MSESSAAALGAPLLVTIVTACALVYAILAPSTVRAAAPSLVAARRVADALDVALVDQAGRPFTLGAISAKRPVIYTFVATRCKDACPIANAIFGRTTQQLQRKHLDAMLVTITLDPAYDTPFVMAREARRFEADPALWKFASGSVAAVHRLMRAAGVVTRPDARGVPEAHGSFVYLIGPRDTESSNARTFLLSNNLPDEIVAALPAA